MLSMIVFISCLVSYPIMTLLHEIGHACVLLLLTKQQAIILMGDPLEKKTVKEFKCGRLTIGKKGMKIYRGFSYLSEAYPLDRKWKLILYFLGGAIANFLMIVFCLWGINASEDTIWIAIFNGVIYANIAQLCVLVPMTYSDGLRSDGQQILDTMKRKKG